MSEIIRILADYREKPSGVPDLLKQDEVDVTIDNLSAGDYLINEQIIVERKTSRDFIQSLLSNRLFGQCSKLNRKFGYQLFIIEGDPYKTDHKVSWQAIRGAMLSISVAWQIPVFFSKDPSETADILIIAGKQNLQNKFPLLRKGYKPKKPKNRQLYFLQGLPSIGPSLAVRLLEHFGTIENVLNASLDELTGIKGIGKGKAIEIKDFINLRYE